MCVCVCVCVCVRACLCVCVCVLLLRRVAPTLSLLLGLQKVKETLKPLAQACEQAREVHSELQTASVKCADRMKKVNATRNAYDHAASHLHAWHLNLLHVSLCVCVCVCVCVCGVRVCVWRSCVCVCAYACACLHYC